MRGVARALVIVTAVLLVPSIVRAQATIAGVVKDASGGVLPGVSVEAASPALDGKGPVGRDRRHRPVPHRRAAARHLHGHVHAAGLQHRQARRHPAERHAHRRRSTSTCASARLEETVTVTGESPIVDVQSARRQQVIDGDVLQPIPTSRSYNNVLQLVPGVVGRRRPGAAASGDAAVHGARRQRRRRPPDARRHQHRRVARRRRRLGLHPRHAEHRRKSSSPSPATSARPRPAARR